MAGNNPVILFFLIIIYLYEIIIWFFCLSICSVIMSRFVPIPITPLMIIRTIGQKVEGKEIKMRKDWVSLKKIGTSIPLAVIAAEDKKFEEQLRFDIESVRAQV